MVLEETEHLRSKESSIQDSLRGLLATVVIMLMSLIVSRTCCRVSKSKGKAAHEHKRLFIFERITF